MNVPGHLKEKFVPIVINRTAIFFLVMCLLTMFLYAAGTVQEFIDSTQLGLLRLYSVLGIFLALTSFSGVVLNLWRLVTIKKGRYLFRAAAYTMLVLLAASTVLAAMFIVTMSGGNISLE